MKKCRIPGCDGTIVTETKVDGEQLKNFSPYDLSNTKKIREVRSGKKETTHYCNKCGVVYHFN